MTTQTTQGETTQPQPVSFDNISLGSIAFSETFKLSKGTASQVVLGLKHMSEKEYTATNEYQTELYPEIKKLCSLLVSDYESTFLSSEDETQRKVWGVFLNGFKNNGVLFRAIPSGINPGLTYKYAQFGQLLKLLKSRLTFVTSRDLEKMSRYNGTRGEVNQEEKASFLKLQGVCTTFVTLLDSVIEGWTAFVSSLRTKTGQTVQKPVEQGERTQVRVQRTSHRHQDQQEHRGQTRPTRPTGTRPGPNRFSNQGRPQTRTQPQA